MSDYLRRLATRLVEPPAQIRPRPASRFEAPETIGPPLADTAFSQVVSGTPVPRPHLVRPPLASARALPAQRQQTPRTERSIAPPLLAKADPAVAARRHGEVATDRALREVHAPANAAGPTDAGVAMADQVPRASREPDTVAPQPTPPPIALALPAAARRSPAAGGEADEVRRPVLADRVAQWRDPVERAAQEPVKAAALATPSAAAADTSPTVVQVTIGKVEVRAPSPPRAQPTAPDRAGPRLSLQNYLQRRGESRHR